MGIKSILFFWTITGYIRKTLNTTDNKYEIDPILSFDKIQTMVEKGKDLH